MSLPAFFNRIMCMELVYLYHSGFALLADGVTVIMDYFEDSVSAGAGVLHDRILQRPGRIYVLASHFHADHFNPDILSWRERRPDAVYLLSRDIYRHRKPVREVPGIVWLRRGDEYADEGLRVRAFGSTDVGVSFWFSLQGHTFFHAGDLNNWHWMDESSEEEWRRSERLFLIELGRLKKFAPQLDCVMFPVDPRLGREYDRGARQLVEQIKTAIFVPMHFDEAYAAAAAFGPVAGRTGARMVELRQRGQTEQLF